MDLFTWDRTFEIDIPAVDTQHKALVEQINSFGLLISQQKIDKDRLDQVISELITYSQSHFHDEQKLMLDAGLDSRYTSVHVKEHGHFIREIDKQSLAKDFSAATGKELFSFLVNWLIYHILDSDASMARQIKMINEGISPAEAFDLWEREPTTVKEFLLESLLNLFGQLSTRNKELQELNLELEQRVEIRTRELSAANEQLGQLAMTDTLTGLANRRKAMIALKTLWDDEEQALSCIMIDADKFKQINDSFGHDAGDLVLTRLASELADAVRTDDLVCRLGGDEFFILCPETDLEGALQLAEQIHQQVKQMNVEVPGGSWYGSISVGVAARNEQTSNQEELIKIADNGVLLAKEQGKNCVRVGSRN
jgi:hemerythrin